MLITWLDISLLGFVAILGVTIWEQNRQKTLLENVYDLVNKHNSLADAFVELANDFDQQQENDNG
jgi:hypothetical protein